MHLSLFIAKRYLFSRKKQNAINIISGISMVGVAIGTTALVVILSVFNGIDLLLQESTDNLTPDLVISPAKGKFIHFDTLHYAELNRQPSIAYYHPVVEENALLKYGDNLKPVTLKGIGQEYEKHVDFSRNMIEGEFKLRAGDSFFGRSGLRRGAGIGYRIEISDSVEILLSQQNILLFVAGGFEHGIFIPCRIFFLPAGTG